MRRARRSEPNAVSSRTSSPRSESVMSRSTSEPARDMMYMFLTRSDISRVNCARSAPVSTYWATQRKHAATSRTPTAAISSTISLESMEPSRRSAPDSVTSPFSNAMICSSEVSALRRPPSARRAINSSASPSNRTPSAVHTAPSLDTMDSGAMRRKSKRWQREWMVSGTFCGSVVHKMNTTCDGGSSSVFSNALNAAVESMWTSSTM